MTKAQARTDRAAAEAARRAAAAEKAAIAQRRAINGKRHKLTRDDADTIREILHQRAVIEGAALEIDRLVIELRDGGCSWTQVASAIDTTKQGAMKRYAAANERMRQNW